MLKAISILPLLSTLAWANPPSATEVLKGDQLKRAKIRWVRQESGAPVTVEAYAGEAFRTSPDWQPVPVKVPWDLKKHATLEKALRAANLGPSDKKPAKRGDRTLEVLVESDKTWEVIGHWTRPAKSWRKQFAGIYEGLEPLCDVPADLFQPVNSDAAKAGDLKSPQK
jgi:hypothetical protein